MVFSLSLYYNCVYVDHCALVAIYNQGTNYSTTRASERQVGDGAEHTELGLDSASRTK